MSFPLILAGGARSPQIQRSLRFRASASAYMVRPRTTSNTTTTFTLHFAIKLGLVDANNRMLAYGYFDANNYSYLSMSAGVLLLVTVVAGTSYILTVGATHRDSSGFLFVTVGVDTTQAVAANRVAFDVNGKIIPHTGTAMPQNLGMTLTNQGSDQFLGSNQAGTSTSFFDGYMARHCCVNGSKLASTYFLNFNGFTRTFEAKSDDALKGLVGNGGLGGYYLTFADTTSLSTLGTDKSSKGNNWTPVNFSLAGGVNYDSMLDVPLGGGGGERGNYATLNPLDQGSGTSHFIKEGNLLLETGSTGYSGTRCTIATPTSGKWYWESTQAVISGGMIVGISSSAESQPTVPGETAQSFGYVSDGAKRTSGANTGYGAAYTTNDVIGVALDLDAGTLVFYKNNVSQGTAFSGISGAFLPMLSDYSNSQSSSAYVNFGQRPFAYTPPTGFKALHTGNLPASAIPNPKAKMDVVLRAGTSASQTVAGLAFSPDLVWNKSRSAADNHVLIDSVRGIANYLSSDLTSAEIADATRVTSFNADGLTFGTSSGVNLSGRAYVDWLWKAGGAPIANNAGSIPSQVSADPQAGFSIVTYTGTGANATVGHGLGVAPKLIILKRRDAGGSAWGVYHASVGSGSYLLLNTTDAAAVNAGFWQNTPPSSSVFSIGTNGTPNPTSGTMVAYCWAEIPDYSKIGSYIGNGSTDGRFVHCGFSPRYFLSKRTDVVSNWVVIDSAINPNNPASQYFTLDQSIAESSYTGRDIVANGIKLRNTDVSINANGGTYIFVAFAETPFKYALAR